MSASVASCFITTTIRDLPGHDLPGPTTPETQRPRVFGPGSLSLRLQVTTPGSARRKYQSQKHRCCIRRSW